jgi:hypothetical protein
MTISVTLTHDNYWTFTEAASTRILAILNAFSSAQAGWKWGRIEETLSS